MIPIPRIVQHFQRRVVSPSPLGRGRDLSRLSANANASDGPRVVARFSLSPGERAGVRGNEASLILVCPIVPTSGFHWGLAAGTAALRGQGRRAFTLIEMLVVLAIIAIIAGISVPAIRALTKSNVITDANRQLKDDLSYARSKAISGRTTVYVLFAPKLAPASQLNSALLTDADRELLISGRYNSYAIFTRRSVGDQPGTENPRYLREWKSLPEGVFFAPWKFDPGSQNGVQGFETDTFPVPRLGGVNLSIPYISFNYQGGLISGVCLNCSVTIPLTRGSLLISPRKSNGSLDVSNLGVINVDFQENPPGNSTNNINWIQIDGLTGRAKVFRPELQ